MGIGSSDDGKGSSNSELVTTLTVGMRIDGCSVAGCIIEGNSSETVDD